MDRHHGCLFEGGSGTKRQTDVFWNPPWGYFGCSFFGQATLVFSDFAFKIQPVARKKVQIAYFSHFAGIWGILSHRVMSSIILCGFCFTGPRVGAEGTFSWSLNRFHKRQSDPWSLILDNCRKSVYFQQVLHFFKKFEVILQTEKRREK